MWKMIPELILLSVWELAKNKILQTDSFKEVHYVQVFMDNQDNKV